MKRVGAFLLAIVMTRGRGGCGGAIQSGVSILIRHSLALAALTVLLPACHGTKYEQPLWHWRTYKAAEHYCLDPPLPGWLDECDESESGICIFVLDVKPGTRLFFWPPAEAGGRLSQIHGTWIDEDVSLEAIAASMVESVAENSQLAKKRTRFEVIDWHPMTISGLPGYFFSVSIDYADRVGAQGGFIGDRCLESFAFTVEGSKLYLLTYAPGVPCSSVKNHDQRLGKFMDVVHRFRTKKSCQGVNAALDSR